MDKQGRRVIREYLPDQFRQFFAQLPYVIVGTVDPTGHPWASILVGNPGFLASPSDRTTRRRNRMNGIVTSHKRLSGGR